MAGAWADLVRLSWTDRSGDDGHAILPRHRAEALVAWILGRYGSRYELCVEKWKPET